eukprot:9180882-Pyramimonas_sp.AAC.1
MKRAGGPQADPEVARARNGAQNKMKTQTWNTEQKRPRRDSMLSAMYLRCVNFHNGVDAAISRLSAMRFG